MPYIPHSEGDIEQMLETIGVTSIDELFEAIPECARFDGELGLPPALLLLAINLGRYLLGSSLLMTWRLVAAVSGVRFRMVLILVSVAFCLPHDAGTMWWSSRSSCWGTLPVTQSRAP